MFTNHNPATAYQNIGSQSNIESASPHKLVELLYTAAIDRISQATGQIDRQEIQSKGQNIGKAISIIEELRRTLNMDGGGEVAENLHDLYVYINERLVVANLKSDKEILNECKSLLTQLSDGWKGISEEVKTELKH